MTADGIPGTKNQPQFLGTGSPATAADLNIIANYAALVGNRKSLTSAERLALTGIDRWDGLEVFDKTDGRTYRWMSGGWDAVGVRLLGSSDATPAQIVAGAPTWSDLCSVSATSRGGICVADWRAVAFNGASGADRTVQYRVVLDGSPIGPASLGPFPILLALTNARHAASYVHRSQPAAGSHTWKLQATASIASAVQIDQATLTVTEV